MTILALFQNDRVYVGNLNLLNAVYPLPCLSPMSIGRLCGTAKELFTPYREALFREDSFDPTTRIRRGRFYVPDSPDQRPWDARQVNHYPYAQPVLGTPQTLDFKVYRDLQITGSVTGLMLCLGSENYFTTWRVVAAERIFNGETLFTLKATNAFDILSAIDRDALPSDAQAEILAGAETVIDAGLKYLPVSTVDVCREFARLLVASWLKGLGVSAEGDLGTLIKNIPKDYPAISSAAAILARLHSRGKSSEQERQANIGTKIRPIADADADLSIALVGFLLRDFGWAP